MAKPRKNKNPYAKPVKKHSITPTTIALIIVAICIAIPIGHKYYKKAQQNAQVQQAQTELSVWSDKILDTVKQENKHDYNIMPDGQYAVFASYSTGMGRPKVRYGLGDSLEQAWAAANAKILNTLNYDVTDAEYIKYDVIREIETMDTIDVRLRLSVTPIDRFDYGIVFGTDMNFAMLREEIDALKPFDTNTWEFNLVQLNGYLNQNGRLQMSSLPKQMQVFRCDSWFYDIKNDELISLTSEKNQATTREFDLTPENILKILDTSNQHLVNRLDENGRFEYRIYPLTLGTDDEYSTIRHVGTLWAMCQNASLTGNTSIKPEIEKSIQYLVDNFIQYDEHNNAYFVEESSNDIESGGTSLMIVMLQTYADIFDSNKYDSLIQALANGLIAHQNEAGSIPHIMDRNLNVTEAYNVIYFEGEACLGLFRAYDRLKSQETLDAAIKYFNLFMENNYQNEGDHWLAYASNEITKLYPTNQDYYDFAFGNAQTALDVIETNTVISPTDLELLANTYEVYLRAQENGITIPDWFEADRFTELTHKQAEKELYLYMFPEKAMYALDCDDILYTFYVDTLQEWRIRIDDVQHATNGYYLYYKLFA